MERNDKTNSILRQFRKKSKRIVNKDFFTEFFYLNRERRIIEFLSTDDELIMNVFLKKFLPSEFRDFVKVKILNDTEEEIKTWYYDSENLVLIIDVNWGFRRQEISIDVDIENFSVTVIDEKGFVLKEVDYNLFNDFIISFFTNQANNLAQSYEMITKKKVNLNENKN